MAQILIVDPDIYASELVSVYLEAGGHRVQSVADGLTAVKALQSDSVDVLISETTVPMRSGYELIRLALALPAPRSPLCFLLTSNVTRAQIGVARALGAYNILRKPFSPFELQNTVDRALEARCIKLAA